MRLREVDGVHPREILVAVGNPVRAAGRMRALGAELGLERGNEDLEQVERQRVRVAPEGVAHGIVDDRAEHDRRLSLARRRFVDLLDHRRDLFGRVDERDRQPGELDFLELRQQAVAQHFGRDPGAVGDEKDGATNSHAVIVRWQAALRRSLPVLPDRHHARGKIGQVAEIHPVLAGPVPVRTAGSAKPQDARVRREFRVLRGRMRWRQDFDSITARVGEFRKQLAHAGRAHAIAAGVRDHGLPAGRMDPIDRLRAATPTRGPRSPACRA